MRAYSDNIILKPVEEEVSKLLIHVPNFVRKMNFLRKGVVISAGPGIDNMKMPVEPGNTVIFDRNAGTTIELNHEKLHIIKLHNLICAKP